MKSLGDLEAWVLNQVIGPKLFIIDHPGYLYSKFTVGHDDVFQRIVFFPENILIEIEEKIQKKYGREGLQRLYSAGKKFGYAFAAKLKVPTAKTANNTFVEAGFNLLLTYILGDWYSKQAKVAVSISKKELKIQLDSFIACPKNGFGYFLTSGGATGIWAWAINDKTVEGTQIKCQGRGDSFCEVLIAEKEKIAKIDKNYFEEHEINYNYNQEYYDFNAPVQKATDRKSLQILFDTGLFTIDKKIITYKKTRFFPIEIGAIYYLEKEINKLPDGKNILFQSAYDHMKELSKDEKDNSFLEDFLTALGYGIVYVNEEKDLKIISKNFLWMDKNNESEIFKGMVSGLISGIKKKDKLLKRMQLDIYEGTYEASVRE